MPPNSFQDYAHAFLRDAWKHNVSFSIAASLRPANAEQYHAALIYCRPYMLHRLTAGGSETRWQTTIALAPRIHDISKEKKISDNPRSYYIQYTGWPKMAPFFVCLKFIKYNDINRFSKFFHCQHQEKICNNTITKDDRSHHTSSVSLHYLVKCQTLKSNNYWKQARRLL